MATRSINTYTNQADFDRVGEAISKGVPGYKALLQSATIAALSHLTKHGNYNVIRPLWDAAQTFSAGEGRKYLDYMVTYSGLTYNPNKLRGEQLNKATFAELWSAKGAKAKGDIDAARKVNWFDHVKVRADNGKPVDLRKYMARIVKAMNALVVANRLAMPTQDGKGIARMATAADVRSAMREAIEEIVKPKAVAPRDGRKSLPKEKPVAKAKKAVKVAAKKAEPALKKAA